MIETFMKWTVKVSQDNIQQPNNLSIPGARARSNSNNTNDDNNDTDNNDNSNSNNHTNDRTTNNTKHTNNVNTTTNNTTNNNLPPLIITPPNKKSFLWGDFFFTINLDGGTITPLINDDFWFDLPPS